MESDTHQSHNQGNKETQESIGYWNIMKAAYSNKPYIFLAINLFCFIIFFFVLDKNTGGSYGARIFVVAFCVIVGGFFGALWSVSRNGSKVSWFRYGSGTLLVILTLMLWAGNGKYDSHGNYHSPSNSYGQNNHKCEWCNNSFSGNGWSTIGGEQFQQTSWSGAGFCSKKCAYDSQPNRWK